MTKIAATLFVALLAGCTGEVITKDQSTGLEVEERAPQAPVVSRVERAPEAALPASSTCHQGTLRDDSICKLAYGQLGEVQQLSTWWCPIDEAAGPYGNGPYSQMPQWQNSCRHQMNNGSTDSIWCCN